MAYRITPESLSITLRGHCETELFKWFFTCLLCAKPVQQQIIQRTYAVFIDHGFTAAEPFLDAGWERLVALLDAGHYVRYDYTTATMLQYVMMRFVATYGSVHTLLSSASSPQELSRLLQEFWGVGPKTAALFMQEI